MSKLVHAMYAALIAAPLIGVATDTAAQGVAGAARAAAQAGQSGAQSGGGGGGAMNGGGFRGGGGGFRGGGFRDRGDFRFRGGFYGGFGPAFGFGFYDPWYDPFWGPRFGYGYYGYYPYDYYPPPTRVIVRDRIPEPGYLPPPDEPPPAQNWYRCDNPQGFYPYVRNCNGPWQSVPVTPPNAPGPPQR